MMEKQTEKRRGILKKIAGATLALTLCFTGVALAGCKDGEDGENGKDGAQWHTGIETPTNQGVDGDFYIDTDDYILYQKINGEWVIITEDFGKPGESGLPGDDGETPYIGSNGNWWINGEDTGYKAVGEDGKSSTIAIDEDGYIIINGENTGYTADLTQQELYENLEGLIEYDDGSSSFKTEHESVVGYDYLNQWEYTTSTFSGWAGSIGKPKTIDAIKFKVRARETAITEISVLLAESNREGKIVSRKHLDVNVQPGEEADIIWQLDEPIINNENINYYFAFSCNALVDKYGNINASNQQIPEEEIPYSDQLRYCINGTLRDDFNGYMGIEGGGGPNPKYVYLPVQVGEVMATFKLADSVVEKILAMIDVEGDLFTNTDLVLPSTVYGFVGQKMQIYFRNITAYSLDDLYIQVTSGGKGDQYEDRWEYTPTVAEKFTLTIDIYSKNWNLLSSSKFNIEIKDTTSKNTARAIVIGDSTVAAGTETQKMVELSGTDEQFELSLLGTLGSGSNLHEGRGGWTAYNYVNSSESNEKTNPFFNPSTQKFDFEYYMTSQGYDEEGVDVVFLQLGINDIFSRNSSNLQAGIDLFIENMQYIVDDILKYNADIKVVINLIIPCDQDQNSFSETYHTSQTVWGYMRNMYQANKQLLKSFADKQNVYLSWYNAALDAVNNQGGNVHPAEAGYNQLGTQMYYFLKAIL